MAKNAVGTVVDESISFNSGFLTLNSGYNVDVSDITVNQGFSTQDLRTLNSIKKRAIRRSTLEQSVSCTIQGQWSQLSKYFFSSSSPVSGGTEYEIYDGQQDDATIYLTVNVDNDDGTVSGQYQYQLTNPIISTNNDSLSTEAYGNKTVDIMCKEIKLVVDTGAENL
jgi:hypothetical protein